MSETRAEAEGDARTGDVKVTSPVAASLPRGTPMQSPVPPEGTCSLQPIFQLAGKADGVTHLLKTPQ